MQNTDCEHATSHGPRVIRSRHTRIQSPGRGGAARAARRRTARSAREPTRAERPPSRHTLASAGGVARPGPVACLLLLPPRRRPRRRLPFPAAAAAALSPPSPPAPPSPRPRPPASSRVGPTVTAVEPRAVGARVDARSGTNLRRAQGAASERRRRWEMAHVVRLSFGGSACRAQGRRAGVRRGPDQGGDAPGPAVPPRGTPPARRFSGVIGQRRDSLVDAGRWLELSLASSVSVLGRLL